MHFETFPALAAQPLIHAFTLRVPGLDVKTDRPTALARLASYHENTRQALGLGDRKLITAQQVHGNHSQIVYAHTHAPVPGADALITDDPRVCLGIHVADCGPVFLYDPRHHAIACIHSGKKGTQLGIVGAVLRKMRAAYRSDPARMLAVLGPCIRPPHYEVDFAADILAQCRKAGIEQIHDCGRCTASEPERYYSYRREKGETGRMLAILALA